MNERWLAVWVVVGLGCSSAAPVDALDAGNSSTSPVVDVGAVPNPTGLTWHKDVRALVEERCANCHQAGEIGPFDLTDYDSVSAGRRLLSVQSGSMPPWQAARDAMITTEITA